MAFVGVGDLGFPAEWVEGQEEACDVLAADEGREGHGDDGGESEDFESGYGDVADGESAKAEEEGELAGLGEEEACFDGGACVHAAPFGDGGDEGWGAEDDDEGELHGAPPMCGIGDADEHAEGDEEEGEEEIG